MTEQNTCETCRHWSPREISMPATTWGKVGVCRYAGEWSLGWRDIPTGHNAWTGSYEEAVLITRPTFGCNMHEPKE